MTVLTAEEKTKNLATHTLFDDPPHALSSVERRTCSKCGRAALTNGNHTYGSALEDPCSRLPVVYRKTVTP